MCLTTFIVTLLPLPQSPCDIYPLDIPPELYFSRFHHVFYAVVFNINARNKLLTNHLSHISSSHQLQSMYIIPTAPLCDETGVYIAAGLRVERYRVQILVVARNIFLLQDVQSSSVVQPSYSMGTGVLSRRYGN